MTLSEVFYFQKKCTIFVGSTIRFEKEYKNEGTIHLSGQILNELLSTVRVLASFFLRAFSAALGSQGTLRP